jgi:hypothetical protein
MSWQNGSDIGVQVLLVARDGIRLEVVRVPLQVVDEGEYTLVPVEATDASRRRWIQAASPPPPRVDGCPWYEPFLPGRQLPDWLQPAPAAADSPYDPYDGLPKLARPPAEAIVLDQQVELGVQRGRQVQFTRPAPGHALGFPASGYPLPDEPVEADAYALLELAWRQPLQPGAWIALSFDRFDPNALSTAFLVKVTDAWLFEDRETTYPKALAAG